MTGIAVVGAAETTELGKIPHLSQHQLTQMRLSMQWLTRV